MTTNFMVLCAFMIVGITVLNGFAHSGAKGVVKERMDTMKSIASAMKRIAGIRRSDKFQPQIVVEAVRKIAKDSQQISGQYPQGEFALPSEALPLIHDNWDQFLDLVEEMRKYALRIEVQAASASTFKDIEASFTNLGGTCKSCHEKFRLKR